MRDENGNEVMWIGVCDVLDTIGGRYALAHIMERIKQGVESKPAMIGYRHMAGEIACFGDAIATGASAFASTISGKTSIDDAASWDRDVRRGTAPLSESAIRH